MAKPLYKDYTVVDLFCGIGGLTHGFFKENFSISGGIDIDKSCQYAFEANNHAKFYQKDLTSLKGADLTNLYKKGKRKILIGCAPCQPFSIYNNQNKKVSSRVQEDLKWQLLYSFSRLIKEVRPDIVSMENVPLLKKFENGKVFNDFVFALEEMGYFVSSYIVHAEDYGVPQRRRRLVLFGSIYGKVDLIEPTIKDGKYMTVRDAIAKLPPIEDGIPHPQDPLHRSRKLNDLNKRRIKASSEGGFWRDWDASLQLDCHKKESGKPFRSVYGRMKWDDIAPTMTTYCTGLGNGRFGHPEQDRAISLREASLFQSFPIDYKFYKPEGGLYSSQILARHIGNAVPVGLGVAIAKSIKKHIRNFGK